MNARQREVIMECVGRRVAHPPGPIQWRDLLAVLRELIAEDDAKRAT